MASADSQVILITGCSSGFGRQITTEALGRGLRVIATARRLEAIDDLRAKGAKTLALDITADQASLQHFVGEAIKVFGHVDILVNNAGYLQSGAMEEVSPEELRGVFETNVFGTATFTNVFLPHFRERQTGLIVNISSMGGYFAYPGAGAYGATKAALDYISRMWAKELAPFNVRSVSINPGLFRTSGAAAMKSSSKEIDCYEEIHAGLKQYRANSGKEPGDVKKAAIKMLDFITSDQELPSRLALGEDAVALLDGEIQREVKDFETWGQFGKGTDVDA
ncbi:hypothetical protein V5O48_017689 [Marasmius crinis-equi]|uniref:Ketoreductase domain-containing protein n=1 Tax=Marasmius crinis-equi TaxID=585013 RepID=A0ABR3EN90_9AGAR